MGRLETIEDKGRRGTYVDKIHRVHSPQNCRKREDTDQRK